MKTSLSLTTVILLLLLSLTAVSCGKDEKEEPELLEITAKDLASKAFVSLSPEVLPGYSEADVKTVLVFVSPRHVYWQWSFLDESGVWGVGSYKVRDNVITIKFPNLYVIDDYEYGTLGGFIDGQAYTERYTIASYNGQYMTLINSDGRAEVFQASKYIRQPESIIPIKDIPEPA